MEHSLVHLVQVVKLELLEHRVRELLEQVEHREVPVVVELLV